MVVYKPHIDIEVSVGDKLKAISEHTFEVEAEEDQEEPITKQIVNLDQLSVDTQFKIFRGSEEIYDEDEYGILPWFNLKFVEILPGNKIRMEGIEDLGDEDELEESEREFFSYILTRNEVLEFEKRKKTDRLLSLKKQAEESEKPLIIRKEDVEDPFDWKVIREKFTSDPSARKALACFLLPYFDMPTMDGHYYVLPEEMVND